MSTKAASELTVTDETDVDSLVTWYALTTSATAPAAPATTQTSAIPASPWVASEPTFTAGAATNYLYTCVQTRWKDGTCDWGSVQLSSSYEQAKQAWNAAAAASDAATSAGAAASAARQVADDAAAGVESLRANVVVASDGLHVVPLGNGYSILLAPDAMRIRDAQGNLVAEYGAGMRILDGQGNDLASFGATTVIGGLADTHLTMTGDRLAFVTGSGDEVAYIAVDQGTGESTFYMTRSVVVKDLRFGDWMWLQRANGNMALKWMGE